MKLFSLKLISQKFFFVCLASQYFNRHPKMINIVGVCKILICRCFEFFCSLLGGHRTKAFKKHSIFKNDKLFIKDLFD